MAIKRGTARSDILRGSTGADSLFGLGGNDKLFGKSGNDKLFGGTGKDTLDGGRGRDTMTGGTGNDTYAVDNAGDRVIEKAGQGTDTVNSSVTHTLSLNVENLVLTGAGAINGTGNSLANTLTGNAAANTLDGGAGSDIMSGGAGNDTYIVDSAGDTVTEAAGGGTDTVNSSVTHTLSLNVENLVLTGAGAINGTGNALANTITGNAAANTLDGGAGADNLIGGDNNDTYFVDNAGDVVTELFNEGGSDEVRTTLLTYVLPSNVEALNFVGVGNFTGTGNGLVNGIGGSSGNDTLSGGAGDDRIYGAGGQDTLNGGLDADTFLFISVSDSAPGTPDIISDFFQAEGDKIDLSLIDANNVLGGDQSFFFIGMITFTGGFNSPMGEVRFFYDNVNNWTVIEVNLDDGGATADMAIRLVGNITLSAADFTL